MFRNRDEHAPSGLPFIGALSMGALAFAGNASGGSPPDRDRKDGGGGGGIAQYSENSRYWQINGQPVMMIGGTDTDAPFQWDKATLTEQLDMLAAAGGNYVRNVMSDRGIKVSGHTRRDNDVYAFAQQRDGLFDLDQWNDEYWVRFTRFLDETATRGVFVQIELWDRHDFNPVSERSPRGWGNHPWNPRNNVNYAAANSLLDEDENASTSNLALWQVPTRPDDPALPYLERFVAKVMDISLRYDHVLYAMDNEADHSPAWGRYWSNFIKEMADAAGKSIQRAPMLNTPVDTVKEAIDHPLSYEFADISQAAHKFKQEHADMLVELWKRFSSRPVPLNSIKQYGGPMDLWFARGREDEGAARAWRTIFCGGATVRYHRPPAGIGLSEKAKAHIAALRMVTDMVEPWNALPHQQALHLLSGREDDEAYIMADPGRVYAVYMPHDADFPNKANFTVGLDVSAVSGPVLVRWYDIESGKWRGDLAFPSSAKTVTLKRPDAAHWVAVVTPQEK